MTFDEILRSELINVTNLNKVYPLIAPKNEDAPFLVYRKGITEFSKTMQGYEMRYDSNYNIVIIAKTYSALQTLEIDVVNKLVSLLGQTISSVLIRGVTVSVQGNEYIEEVDWYRSDINFNVKY